MFQVESRRQTMPVTANSTAPARTKQVSGEDDLSRGLTSTEARARLAKYGPNTMPDTAVRPWRMALAKFWAPVPWMLEAAIIPPDRAARVCRSGGHRWTPGVQRRSRVLPGGTCTGYSCRAEIAARTFGFGAAGRRLEEYTRCGTCARRHGEAVARGRGCRRRKVA